MCRMVPVIEQRTVGRRAKAPRRVDKTRPGNLRRYHLPSGVGLGNQPRLRGRFVLADDQRPECALTLPADAVDESAVLVEGRYLPVLVLPLSGDRDALARLPRSSRPQRPVPVWVNCSHLL